MDKTKRRVYLLLVIIIFIATIYVYILQNRNNNNQTGKRTKSEIYFLENTIVTLLNSVNNIETRNYNVSIEEIPNNERESNKKNNNQSKETEEKINEKGEENKKSDESKLFELKHTSIISQNEEIDWKTLQKEVEIIYNSIPTIALDLYENKIVKEDIVNFNKEFDKLIISIKNKNKEETLKNLTLIYEYIVKFIENTDEDKITKVFIKTKSDIFKAYAMLDSNNWDGIKEMLEKAIKTYSELLNETNIKNEQKYTVSKGYMMLGELKNSIELKDKTVFLIKYKNLLEEINNI